MKRTVLTIAALSALMITGCTTQGDGIHVSDTPVRVFSLLDVQVTNYHDSFNGNGGNVNRKDDK